MTRFHTNLLTLLIVTIFSTGIYSQNYGKLLKTHKEYIKKDSLKSKQAIQSYLKLAKRNNDTLHIAHGYKYLYFMNQGNKIKYLDSIISITEQNQSAEYPAFAYIKKAKNDFTQKRDIKKTLQNLNLARKYAQTNNNVILLHRIDYFIATVLSEHLGEKEKALKIFKKCAQYFSKEIKEDHKFRYLYSLHAIAEIYIYKKNYDSASYFNRLGHAKASKSSLSYITKTLPYFTICEGINKYKQEEYLAAIDSITIALPKIIQRGDKHNTIDAYFYLGKSYNALGNTEKAISNFKRTDSILETLNSPPQYEHLKTYEVLKEYYKMKNDLHNQNKYLDKLNSFLGDYVNDKIFIGRKIKEDYDIPILLEEQKTIIQKLNNEATISSTRIQFLILFLLILGSLLFYQYRKKRVYQFRFENLIAEQKQKVNSQQQPTNIKKFTPPKPNKTLNVPEKHVIYILNKLDEFEDNEKYLTPGISAQLLANEMETNVKYLSTVINFHKNKTFTHYLNELRIKYAVNELRQNYTLRKYTIKAIAMEMGYNSAETFSNAFYKQVGIKPSYFIKNLNKLELTSSTVPNNGKK